MALHRSAVSCPGEQPDLESSPEVLTWTWTLSFSMGSSDEEEEAMSSPRTRLRVWAFLRESKEETAKRLGMRARGLQWAIHYLCQYLLSCTPSMELGHGHTRLKTTDKMPLNTPRQQLRLLLQLLGIVLAEMDVLDLGSLVQGQNVVGGLELGHGDEPDGATFGDGEDAVLHALELGDERGGPGGVDFEGC